MWLDGTNDGFTRASGDFDAEDGKEFTIGTWFQQLKPGATGGLLAAGDNDAYTALRLDGDGKFYFQTKIGDKILSTDSKWRDTAWYHILVSVDTTQGTAADRVKIFINGVQVALSGTYPDQNVAEALRLGLSIPSLFPVILERVLQRLHPWVWM